MSDILSLSMVGVLLGLMTLTAILGSEDEL